MPDADSLLHGTPTVNGRGVKFWGTTEANVLTQGHTSEVSQTAPISENLWSIPFFKAGLYSGYKFF